MPRYAVHAQYLLPVWTSVIVNAPDEEAAKRLVAEQSLDIWDCAEEDHDSAQQTTIEGIRELEDKDFPEVIPAPGDFEYGAVSARELFDFINGGGGEDIDTSDISEAGEDFFKNAKLTNPAPAPLTCTCCGEIELAGIDAIDEQTWQQWRCPACGNWNDRSDV